MTAGAAPAAGGAQTLLDRWMKALRGRDYAGYLACLHSASQARTSEGTREAMRGWLLSLQQMERQGFAGPFKFVPAGGGHARPLEFRAFPVLADRRLGPPLIVTKEADQWRVKEILWPPWEATPTDSRGGPGP